MDIQLVHICKRYGEKMVFTDLNLTFVQGHLSCLMGASGIGKTTLINLILGLTKADSGQIIGCRDRKCTAVFQEDRLIEHWDAVRNIRLVCSKTVTAEQVRRELHQVGIEDFDKSVSEFSGGMRRRVALVRAIMAKGDILVLDEPFKGLDEELKSRMIAYVKQNTKDKTVIVVTHDKEEARLLEAEVITLS